MTERGLPTAVADALPGRLGAVARRWHARGRPLGMILLALAMVTAFLLAINGLREAATGVAGRTSLLLGQALALAVGGFPPSLTNVPMPVALSLARLLMPLAIWGAVLSLAWRAIRNPVRLWLASRRSGHLVIAGDPLIAAPIVRGERRLGAAVVVLADDADADWVVEAAGLGSPHAALHGGRCLSRYLRKARLVVLSGTDAAANVAVATAIAADDADLRGRGLPLPIIVRVDDLDQRAACERTLWGAVRPDHVQFRLLSLPNLIARTLLRSNILDRVVRPAAAPRTILVVGFGAVMAHYLLQLLVGVHPRDGRAIEIVVLDPDAAQCRATRAEGAAAARWDTVRFETCDLTTAADVAAAVTAMIDGGAVPCAVIVDAGDTSPALLDAIDGAFRARGTVPPAYAVHAASSDAGLASPTLAFGGATMSAHAELLTEERHERLARAIHDFYLEGRLDEGEAIGARPALHDWDHLVESIRDDNRLVVDLYGLKLREIGARIVPGRGASLAFAPAELEDLARAEHDRWRTARTVDGWRAGPARDEAARTHPDLVPYAEAGEATREHDREQVRIITRLLGRVGEHAVRDLRVLVEPVSAHGIAAAIDRLTQDYPDRALIFLGAIEEAGVRRALLAAFEAGLAVEVGADRHPETWLGELDPAEARRTRALLQHADRVIAAPAPADVVAMLAERADLRLGTLPQPAARHRVHA